MGSIRLIICLFVLSLSSALVRSETEKGTRLKALADSVANKVGESDFIAYYEKCIQLAEEVNDTTLIDRVYNDVVRHYYRLGDTDSLKIYTYQYMDWSRKHGNINGRYQVWRQYIQRLTEKGLKDEALAETQSLSKDAEGNKSKYGLACSEMCVGYNHRIFSNDVKLCLDYYNSALKNFKDIAQYEDAYVVSLNIVQIYLARAEYMDAIRVLNDIEKLEKTIVEKRQEVRLELKLRYYQFRVIATLASKGKKAAEPYIRQTDQFYTDHSNLISRDAWLGYKIMCARTLNDLKNVLNYLDSMQEYHHSIGICYPANLLMKAQCLEELGRLSDACKAYQRYAQLNDSVRSAEFDDKLSKYTVQFEVDKLEKDKLELKAEVNKNLFVTSLVIGCLVLILLIVITYFYLRSLSMNRKLDAANKAVVRASRMKSSFIQHITHEIRTPLNSIIGFSSLIADGGLEPDEIKEYTQQMERSNVYLLDLVNNVIDIADMDSQTEDIPKAAINVDACCQECMEIVRPKLKENVELQYVPSSTSLELLTVYPWVKRVLLVLLNNAAKFTESGFVRLKFEEDKTKHLVRFIIEDSGSGVDEQYKDSIFDRFVKLDVFTQGTGLGLPIARQIVDLVDGKIYLDTAYSNGARFIVEWPA